MACVQGTAEDRVLIRDRLPFVRIGHPGHLGRGQRGDGLSSQPRITFTVLAGYRQVFGGDSYGYDAMLRFMLNF